MTIVETLHFPVSSEWWGGRLVNAEAPGKAALRVVPPPEFGGPEGSYWSPEDLLVNAVASCYTLTLTSVARRLRVPLQALRVEAAGHVERDHDGRYGFVLVHLDVELETEPEAVAIAKRAAELAEERCIVGRALAVPVHVSVDIRAPRQGRGRHPRAARGHGRAADRTGARMTRRVAGNP